jgi:hypothetical protein
MFTSDQQILKLPKILKKLGRISSLGQFHEETSISKQHFTNVKNQEKYGIPNHFTPKQIEAVIKIYKVNANWIFGMSDEVFEGIVEHYIEY